MAVGRTETRGRGKITLGVAVLDKLVGPHGLAVLLGLLVDPADVELRFRRTFPVRPVLHDLLEHGQRAFGILDSREEKESHSPASVKDIVDDTMSLIQTMLLRNQINLDIDILEDLPKIRCRSQQIRQVIMNLVTNAKDSLNEKYSGYDENKKIAISSSMFEKDQRRWIRTTVEDHGLGIDPGIKERLFDPFFTTKPKES